MERAALEHALALLPADEQDRVAAFLTALRMKRDGLAEEFQRRLDDQTSENWVSWKSAKADLSSDSGE